MTQEDKDLLLKDLCARLPYGVKGIIEDGIKVTTPSEWPVEKSIDYSMRYMVIKNGWRPYLFPMPYIDDNEKLFAEYITTLTYDSNIHSAVPTIKTLDFYNKYHLDYRGFIPKGIALDATSKNIY